MDLLSSIRKSGSRGGVNFSWDEVSTSQHRENYLGHSLMAPVGRWQKGRDLNWYAKADDTKGKDGETAEEKKARERREEIKMIKEAEEDALSRALGLPVADRGTGTGANGISVGEVNRMVKEAGVGDEDEVDDVGKGKGFGDFVVESETIETGVEAERGDIGVIVIGRGAENGEDIGQGVVIGNDTGSEVTGGKGIQVRTGVSDEEAGALIELGVYRKLRIPKSAPNTDPAEVVLLIDEIPIVGKMRTSTGVAETDNIKMRCASLHKNNRRHSAFLHHSKLENGVCWNGYDISCPPTGYITKRMEDCIHSAYIVKAFEALVATAILKLYMTNACEVNIHNMIRFSKKSKLPKWDSSSAL
ncbi:hypothetical protein G7Y89_g4011 [Cudoniella acicularis]|uniref:Multiple myeloma tumor-associated protein 2-like N-terminal domain-containing protein n=1 Tax=Cudoniella acicularis TaxID=354080 RepID=A0A8H4W742_9HELO|nr:hypothetical protein G7Y89_g4011 [Cudoniella acicularis]